VSGESQLSRVYVESHTLPDEPAGRVPLSLSKARTENVYPALLLTIAALSGNMGSAFMSSFSTV